MTLYSFRFESEGSDLKAVFSVVARQREMTPSYHFPKNVNNLVYTWTSMKHPRPHDGGRTSR